MSFRIESIVAAILLVLCGTGAAGGSTLRPLKPEKAISKKKLLADAAAHDKKSIATDRALLRKIAGQTGKEAQRQALLRDISECRREIGMIRSGSPLRFHHLDRWRAFPKKGTIGHITSVKIFQVLNAKNALCRIAYNLTKKEAQRLLETLNLNSLYGGEPLAQPTYVERLFLLRGFDFSNCRNGEHKSVKCMVRVGGIVNYGTAAGGSNTATLIVPVKVTDAKTKAKQRK